MKYNKKKQGGKMKKTIVLLFSLLIIVNTLLLSQNSSDNLRIMTFDSNHYADVSQKSIEATKIEASINSTLKIPIVIEAVTPIEGIDVVIAFNPEILHITRLTINGGILDNKDYGVETNLGVSGQGIIVI